MEPELIFGEIASEHHGIRIVPPQAPVLPIEAQVLPGDTAEDSPLRLMSPELREPSISLNDGQMG